MPAKTYAETQKDAIEFAERELKNVDILDVTQKSEIIRHMMLAYCEGYTRAMDDMNKGIAKALGYKSEKTISGGHGPIIRAQGQILGCSCGLMCSSDNPDQELSEHLARVSR